MRIPSIFIAILLSCDVLAQSKIDTKCDTNLIVYGERLRPFLDSLTRVVLLDTLKFKKQDMVQHNGQLYNRNLYSKLYIVQHLINGSTLNIYTYKLDIIEPGEVLEFVKAYFKDNVIKAVTIPNEVDSTLYPSIPGIISISLLDTAKLNPRVAGLVFIRKGHGSNFRILKKGRRKKLSIRSTTSLRLHWKGDDESLL